MKAKKGLAIAMAALLSLTALAGCSGGAKEAPAAQQKAADTAAGDESGGAAQETADSTEGTGDGSGAA